MRRFHLGLALAALPVLVGTLFLAGCGGKDNASKEGSKNEGQTTQSPPTGELKALTAKNGHLKGEIRLKGSPDIEGRTKSLLTQINMKPDDKAHCLAGTDSEKTEQTYRIGANKLVGNVFVWLRPESGTYFKIDDKQLKEAKDHPVRIHQPHCAFIPHCAVLFTRYAPDPKKPRDLKETGQILKIENDAQMSHNTKWDGGPANPGGNETLPVGKVMSVENLKPSSREVRFSCNIHGWMDGYLRVLDHPYATVSFSDTLDGPNKVKPDDPKFGTYEMKNLPVGNVRVVAWHESGVYLNEGGGNGQPIVIKEGTPTELNFTLEAK